MILAGICAFITVLVLALHFAAGVPFLSIVWSSEQAYEDVLRREGRKTKPHNDFVFIGIDQESLKLTAVGPEEIQNNRAFQLMTERPFPWSREIWALLLDRLFSAGARVVRFDMIFGAHYDGDAAFGAALERYRDKVVIGANFDFSDIPNGGAAINIAPSVSLIPDKPMEDDRVGYVVFFPDALDHKIRSARYTVTDRQLSYQLPQSNETAYESLGARALRKLGHSGDVPRDLQSHSIRFSALDAYLPKALWEVFDPKMWHANYRDGNYFKDKVVIVGASSQVAHDVFDTPLNPETPGPALHLHALAAALDHEFLYGTAIPIDFATVIGGGILSWIVVAYSNWSEKANPAALVAQLNRYLGSMVPMVFDNGGTLDKFIGDAIMAVWGNVSSHGAAEDAKAAVRAALGMRREMPKLNAAWQAEGSNPLAFGIGINHGEAIVGNIGSYEPHERLDPTVIGDAVNLASRLEALTRTYAVDILVGQSAADLVRDDFHFRSVARVQVKGKTEPVEVLTLVGARTDGVDSEFLKWLDIYEEGIANFRKRDF